MVHSLVQYVIINMRNSVNNLALNTKFMKGNAIMKKVRKISLVSVLLILAMISALLPGCDNGGSGTSDSTTASPNADVSGSIATPGTSPGDTDEATDNYFPLAETATLTYLTSMSPPTMSALNLPNDLLAYAELEERTNVHIDFTIIGMPQVDDTMAILVSGDDLPDIVFGVARYFSSLDYAMDEDIIYDLTEAIDQYMPNYNALRTSDEDVRKSTTTDSGRIASIYGIYDNYNIIMYGLMIRQDWLNNLGLSTPRTYDEFYDVLVAFKNEYSTDSALGVLPTGAINGNYLSAGYGVAWDTYGEMIFIIVDGEVKYSPIEAGFKDYIMMMNKWYDTGLVDPDFMAQPDNGGHIDTSHIANNDMGIFGGSIGNVKVYNELATVDNFELAPLADARLTAASEPNHLRKKAELIGNAAMISTNCSDLELACRWLDYFYSDEGWLLANYGIENVSFEYDSNGKPVYTELITNNPDGLSTGNAMLKYCMPGNGTYFIDAQNRYAGIYDMSYPETWAESNNDYYYDSDRYAMNESENVAYSSKYNDIATFVSENVVKFIIGTKNFSEWDDFIATIYEMGIEDCITSLQGSVNRYDDR